MKGVYEFREDEGRDYTKSGDIGDESQVYVLKLKKLGRFGKGGLAVEAWTV